jgi:hypothetical protein
MPLNNKYSSNFLTTLKSLRLSMNILCIISTVVFLFVSLTGFGSVKDSDNVYKSGNSTIVYSVKDSGGLLITKGRITATEGQSIRFLPGTNINGVEQLTINIASKECQKAVALEIAREKEKRMLEASARKRELFQLSDAILHPLPFYFKGLPVKNSEINQQNIQLTASLVNTTVTISSPESILEKRTTIFDFHNLTVSAFQPIYTPSLSWGDYGGTISILLC